MAVAAVSRAASVVGAATVLGVVLLVGALLGAVEVTGSAVRPEQPVAINTTVSATRYPPLLFLSPRAQ